MVKYGLDDFLWARVPREVQSAMRLEMAMSRPWHGAKVAVVMVVFVWRSSGSQ